jgi:hypothetical protein
LLPDTFTNDLPDSGPSTYESNGQSVLRDSEHQYISDFFTSTDPFDFSDSQTLPPALDTKASAHDYNNWEEFAAPATVHRVTTTIPEQAQPYDKYENPPPALRWTHGNYLDNDEMQAASALFNQSQPSYTNTRSHSFHGQPISTASATATRASESSYSNLPMGLAPQGLINEQLAAFIPNHNEQSTMDALFPPQWPSTGPQQSYTDFGPPLQKVDLKNSYHFGTDNSFNSLSNGQESEHHAAARSIHELHDSHNQHIVRALVGVEGQADSPTGYAHPPFTAPTGPVDEEQSDEAISEEEHDPPAKKRKKSQYRVAKETPKKGVRAGKNRKASLVEDSSKKKRASAATQKAQRENLTEEQKRSNHILSEQKRRDLIKQGYKDLNELVPAVRGGGLSKSQILTEAANFLDKLIADNDLYRQMPG